MPVTETGRDETKLAESGVQNRDSWNINNDNGFARKLQNSKQLAGFVHCWQFRRASRNHWQFFRNGTRNGARCDALANRLIDCQTAHRPTTYPAITPKTTHVVMMGTDALVMIESGKLVRIPARTPARIGDIGSLIVAVKNPNANRAQNAPGARHVCPGTTAAP